MTVISQPARWRFWVVMAAVFLVTLWLLNDILLPFVVGIVVAYFLDPVVARLQRLRMSRTWATTAVTIVAVLLTIGAAMAILPPLFAQLQALVVSLPDYTVKLAARVMPLVDPIRERLNLPPLSLQELQSEVAQRAGQVLTVAGAVAGKLAQGGLAIFNLLALLFLTPVVTALRQLAGNGTGDRQHLAGALG